MKPQGQSDSTTPGAAPLDVPPSYDAATESSSMPSPRIDPQPPSHPPPVGPPPGFIPQSPTQKQPYRDEAREPLIPHDIAGPSTIYVQQPMMTAPPTVFNYVNPQTGQVVVSLLPPHHPEMVCLQSGGHYPHTEYGWLGILAAVFWFPLGVGLCLLDRKVKCQRCGALIEPGPCS